MQKLRTVLCLIANVVLLAHVAADELNALPVIIDTDFVMPPSDDSMALMLALQSPELRILGITTVAGNDSVERATSDVLRMLEIANRSAIPVFRGADMPLVREKSEYAVREYGNWYSDDPPPIPHGGFATKRAEDKTAVRFMVDTVMSNPGKITLIALGPLTNIARAIRDEPLFARSVKRIVVMGGAIALLPDGAGNMTPNAEFNFWVDPEAARVTLRAPVSIELSPLNVSRKSALTRREYERLVATDTPLTALIRDSYGPLFDENPDLSLMMFDQIAMASVIDPALVMTESLYVDVDIVRGMNYGVSVGGRETWPGAERARKIEVQHDLNWPDFIGMFVERLQRPLPR